jgi:hypothetical protein
VLGVLAQHPITKKAAMAIRNAILKSMPQTSCLVAQGPAAIDTFNAAFLMSEFSPAAGAYPALYEFPAFLIVAFHSYQSMT